MVKVSEVLNIPSLRGIQVKAGAEYLDREVQNVMVMEVPDIKKWLKGGDFLITRFYSVRRSEDEQCQLIESLSDTCSAIAVKTGSYVTCLGDRVIDTAERCQIPLLEIPADMNYNDIMVNIMNRIFMEQGNNEILDKYLKDIIYENYADEILIKERGKIFGMDIDESYYQSFAMHFKKGYQPSEQELNNIKKAIQIIRQQIMDSHIIKGCYLMSLEKGYMLFIEADDGQKIDQVMRRICVDEHISEIFDGDSTKIICGIGLAKQGLCGIRDTYSGAFKVAHIGRRLDPNKIVFYYHDLEFMCQLESCFQEDRGQMFAQLLDAIDNDEQLETLYAYFNEDGDMDRIAEVMHTHKNTIKYRLGRIQERTGQDIRTPTGNFHLYLAVLAKKMLEN